MFIDMFITLYDDLSKISRSARYQMAKTNEWFRIRKILILISQILDLYRIFYLKVVVCFNMANCCCMF